MACTGNFYIFCVSFDICKFLVGLAGIVYGNDSVCVAVEKSPIYVFTLLSSLSTFTPPQMGIAAAKVSGYRQAISNVPMPPIEMPRIYIRSLSISSI